MDILSQYQHDHPEAFRGQKPRLTTDEYGREYSGMLALVMRLSGGRIKDARQASLTLLIIAVAVFLASMAFFFFARPQGVSRYAPVPVTGERPDVNWPPQK